MSKEKQFPFLKFIIFLLLTTAITLKAQDIIWERTFDTGRSDGAFGVCTDVSGNVIVTGITHSGATKKNWLTIKYNSDGDTLWTRIFDLSSSDWAYGATTDSMGNVIVTGKIITDSTGDDFCTVKYNPDGNILWIRTFSNNDYTNEEAHSVAVDSKGNVIVAGFAFFTSSGYSYDYQTIKYDPDGNIIWVRTYDGGWNDIAEAVTVDDSDNVIVTGYSDHNINWDWCTVKYNPKGDTLWVRRYDFGIDDWARGITVNNAGDVIVSGALGHSQDRLGSIIKYSRNGEFMWKKRFPNIGSFIDVDSDDEGNILLAAWPHEEGFKTAKCNPDGDTLWTQTSSGQLESVTTDKLGNVIVTGGKKRKEGEIFYFDYLTIKYSDATTGIEDESDFSTFSLKYILHQNYPNPFNAETRIEYELPAKSYMCLKIYDVMGRDVVILVDGVEDAGYKSVKFDGANLPSGIYFYQLRTPTFTDMKKLLILK